MDVINLSLGEPEVEPTRDIVVQAIDDAADAGVVPVDRRRQRLRRRRARLHRLARHRARGDHRRRVDGGRRRPGGRDRRASPRAGPSPISLRHEARRRRARRRHPLLAPAQHLVGARLERDEHGDAARRRRRRRARSSAIRTGRSRRSSRRSSRRATRCTFPGRRRRSRPRARAAAASTCRRADDPLVFTAPTGLSFGLVKPGTTTTQTSQTTDAGGGADPWTVSVQTQLAPAGAALAPAAPTVVAGSPVTLTLTVAATAAQGEAAGFVLLTRGTDVRRVPYWFRVESPKLGTEPAQTLTRAGVYTGDTAGKPSLVSSYRYPDDRAGRDRPRRAGAGLPVRAHATGGELRRRRDLTRHGRRRRAAARPRRRREPARRLHGAAHRPEPVLELRPLRARRRGGAARTRHLRHRLRHAGAARARGSSRSGSGSTTRRRPPCASPRRASRTGSPCISP